MNSMFITRKLVFLSIFSISSLLYTSCNQEDQQNAENYQFEERIVPFEESINTSSIPVKNDQNSSHQIYNNETLGISFPRPEGIHIQSTNSTSLEIWTEADYERIEDFSEVFPLSVSVRNNPDNLTAEEWFSAQHDVDRKSVREKMVGNQQGIRVNWEGMWKNTAVVVHHPTRQEIVVINWDNGMSDYEELFEDIVASLVFI